MDIRMFSYAEYLIQNGAALSLLQRPILGKKGTGKMPIEKGWQKKRVSSRELYHWMSTYSNHNIGMLTGSPSQMIVVDIDGDEGLEIFKSISGSNNFDTVTVKTPSGGFHLYYKIPKEHEKMIFRKVVYTGTMEHSECAFLGDGHQVVIPYSTHYSGEIYMFLEGHSPNDLEYKDAPDYIVKKMLKRS